ncbi:MAG: Flp family type IVb pilin [Negativicutes bacterium]|jgi:pilus assembly protein Flp/PilA
MKKLVNMMLWWQNIKASVRNEKGQGMVEYGLILALVAVAVVGVLGAMGDQLNTMFTTVSEGLQ